jgi:hypothetical protein
MPAAANDPKRQLHPWRKGDAMLNLPFRRQGGRIEHTRLRLSRIALVAVMSTAAVSAVALATGLPARSAEEHPARSVLVSRQSPASPRTLAIQDAWTVISTFGQGWDRAATITFLGSIEDEQGTRPDAGSDGLRRSWQARLVAPSHPGAILSVTLRDGMVTEAQVVPWQGSTAAAGRPLVDSTSAIRAVLIARASFAPGFDKSEGIGYFWDASIPGILSVRGSLGEEPSVASVDATDGHVVKIETLSPGSGGVIFSTDGGIHWSASNLNGPIAAVTRDPSTANVGLAVLVSQANLVIFATRDGGATWSELGSLPPDAGLWAYSVTTVPTSQAAPKILVSTRTGLWLSVDGGRSWTLSTTLPAAVTQLMTANNKVFASVASGPGNGAVYSSGDSIDWQLEAEGVYRLSAVDGGVLALDPSRQTALLLGVSTRASVGLATKAATADGPPLRAAGGFPSGIQIVQSPGKIRISEDAGATWRTVTEGRFASLQSSPTFALDGIAIAGGFGTGIYRSQDSGRTWSKVLEDASSLVPGSGEVPFVAFLGGKSVIAVNGTNLQWEERK